ncbi:hypothetical protein [Marinomonas shanghaiensis]|uniref:hypothetical protein n=1 Tax=Marinomonas shanghaiensis TaxID=2202418 RepID=UPI000DB9EBCE|nr:hypothetical protein [Marinomonas shanghaiensis]
MSLVLNKTERFTMLALALVLAAVSVVCEVLLFTEQTVMPIDTALAAIIGLALVCFQFLFAATAAKFWQASKRLIACAMYLITAVLFTISFSATAGFFESRFQENQQTQLYNSNDYKLKMSVIDDLEKQAKTLTDSANSEKQKGNGWYAGQLLIKAAEASEKRRSAIAQLSNQTAPNTDATTALVSVIGAGRWALWIVLAALVDLCPLVAFASYAVRQTPVKTGVTDEKTPNQTPEQQRPTVSQTPNEQPDESQTNAETGRPTLDEIKQAIKQMPAGQVGVRAVMRTAETTNYQRTKQALEELKKEGFLTEENNKYYLNK